MESGEECEALQARRVEGDKTEYREDRTLGKSVEGKRPYPGRRISATVAGPVVFFSQTEKMVPVLTLQSMLDEPSSGSNATQYLRREREGGESNEERMGGEHTPYTPYRPAKPSSTMIGSSFSSLTNTAHTLELYNAFTIISFDSTSSFFCESPVAFSLPAAPYRLAIPALRTLRLINLHAV